MHLHLQETLAGFYLELNRSQMLQLFPVLLDTQSVFQIFTPDMASP